MLSASSFFFVKLIAILILPTCDDDDGELGNPPAKAFRALNDKPLFCFGTSLGLSFIIIVVFCGRILKWAGERRPLKEFETMKILIKKLSQKRPQKWNHNFHSVRRIPPRSTATGPSWNEVNKNENAYRLNIYGKHCQRQTAACASVYRVSHANL